MALPVAAPGYLTVQPGEALLDGLPGAVRLIVELVTPDEWEEFRARGLEPPDPSGAIALDHNEALQVAESGHGLAIGRRPVVDDRLARGTLVAPFGAADSTGAAHYLCRAAGPTPSAAARRVERWLRGLVESTPNVIQVGLKTKSLARSAAATAFEDE